MDFSTYQRPEIEPDQFSGITQRFKNVFRVWEWTKNSNYLWTVFITNAADCAATHRNKHFQIVFQHLLNGVATKYYYKTETKQAILNIWHKA